MFVVSLESLYIKSKKKKHTNKNVTFISSTCSTFTVWIRNCIFSTKSHYGSMGAKGIIYLHFPQKIYQAKITQIPWCPMDRNPGNLWSNFLRANPWEDTPVCHARAFQKARVRWENGEALARRRHQCRWANQVLDSAPCLKGKWLVQLGGT